MQYDIFDTHIEQFKVLLSLGSTDFKCAMDAFFTIEFIESMGYRRDDRGGTVKLLFDSEPR